MLSYVLCAALSATLGQASPPTTTAADRQKMESRQVDGSWEVVYVEMDGKKIENKDFANVTIQNNKLTCKHEGKEKTWILNFGRHHHVRAHETSASTGGTGSTSGTEGNRNQNTAGQSNASNPGGAQASDKGHSHGVYIASKEYLCFSMNHGRDMRHESGGRQTGNESATNPTAQSNPNRTEAQPGQKTSGNQNTQGQGNTIRGGAEDHGAYGSHFVLILRRSASGTPTSR